MHQIIDIQQEPITVLTSTIEHFGRIAISTESTKPDSIPNEAWEIFIGLETVPALIKYLREAERALKRLARKA